MVENIVSFPPEVNEKVGQYCIDHSVSLPGHIKEHKEYTEQNVVNPNKMVSTLQAQFFVWLASDRKARKILEIGCFSGYSALAWAEGQKDVEDAEVVTLENDPLMIAIANDAIMKAEQSSHIRIVEGDALETIPTLHGPFDIIFIDTEKKEYTEVYDMIMERKLLAQDGIIVADNVLAKGCTVDSKVGNPLDSTIQNGVELRKFNDHIAKDDRVDVCVLPMFDGLALIKWRPNMYPLQRVQSHLSINGFGATAAGGRPRSIHRGSFDLHNQRSPSRNSHDLSRTGTPSFHARRLSDEEIEEKDEFSYGFSNRRNSREEFEEKEGAYGNGKKLDDFGRSRNQFVHAVGGFESRNKYYD